MRHKEHPPIIRIQSGFDQEARRNNPGLENKNPNCCFSHKLLPVLYISLGNDAGYRCNVNLVPGYSSVCGFLLSVWFLPRQSSVMAAGCNRYGATMLWLVTWFVWPRLS